MALSSLMWRRLLLLVSTFTLAHTLTLGLAMLGIVEISGQILAFFAWLLLVLGG
jgi:hypothetical protein